MDLSTKLTSPYMINWFKWLSDYCSTRMSNFSALLWQEQVTYWWDDVCCRPTQSSWIFIEIAPCKNSSQVEMSLHSDTLFRFRAFTSLCSYSLALHNLWRNNKYQLYSLWFDPTETQTHDLPPLHHQCNF
jgi:hypothetical protein